MEEGKPMTAFEAITLNGSVGKSIVRRSGHAKVTGTATFTAEWPIIGLLHAVAVPSNIARGKVMSIDTSVAESMPGVRLVLTQRNLPKFTRAKTRIESKQVTNNPSKLFPVAEDEVFYAGQFMAAVVADTFEDARDAALAVKIEYEVGTHVTDIDASPANELPDDLFGSPAVVTKGNAEKQFEAADVKIDSEYPTYGNHHNPIETHATIAQWSEQDGKPFLTVYETSQGLAMSHTTYAELFSLNPKQVRVVCKFIGGAFGSKGAMWPQAILACLCAKAVGAPVKIEVTRGQMYGGIGHRTPTRQRVQIGAAKNGKIEAIIHSGVASSSIKDEYDEAFTMATRMMYETDSLLLDQKRCRLNSQVPTFMRAPAETPGMFALESAMDELAFELKMDPIELRKLNEPEKDLLQNKPFSGRLLLDCLKRGGDAFGWHAGHQVPRQKRVGHWLVGQGVAAATYPVFFFPTEAKLTWNADGRVVISCCSQEMGTGTATVQSQLVADVLGISVNRVSMELGDTDLPPGGISGGSATTGSLGGALLAGIKDLKSKLIELLPMNSPIRKADSAQVTIASGKLMMNGSMIDIDDLLTETHKRSVTGSGKFAPAKDGEFASHSFGAQFVEVGVDEELGLVRLRRMLGCFACGTILNARTGRSQFIGGMIMGVGHAMQEATHWDHRYGRITNDNLAEYHVPVNADIPDIEVLWIDTPDFNASPIGAKGIGEIGITGVAAAIANAVFNATGRRVRELPITAASVMAKS
jgi:xanthine dehydrogenase YagR molybdenum-binding subunit